VTTDPEDAAVSEMLELLTQVAWTQFLLDCTRCQRIFASAPEDCTEQSVGGWAEGVAADARSEGWIAKLVAADGTEYIHVYCSDCAESSKI
jgi:hypothetical protein